MSRWSNDIMVKVSNNGDLLAFRTFDRKHGRSGRFLVLTNDLVAALGDDEYSSHIETDCGDFIRFRRIRDTVLIDFTWISGGETFKGFRQHITIPYETLRRICIVPNSEQKYVWREPENYARINAENAGRNIRNAISTKRGRRAFVRAMRESFKYHGEKVTLYNDGESDFYFRTDRINGGLIRSDYTDRRGHWVTRYSVHT